LDLFDSVMKIYFALFFGLYSIVWTTECAKSYRFISMDSCKTDNELIVAFTKCEVDEMFFTFIAEVRAPITKLIVRF